jgi:type III pantothenate kinase
MILAIDIGNTTVALGGIKDGRVCFVARMDTVRTRTAAEYRAEMEKIFARRRHPERPLRFEGAVLSSVVPQITGALAECARHYTGKKPVIVGPDIRTGLTMGVPHPESVGKDRLVDAAYAAEHFPLPVVTVDMGTATTFNIVDEKRVFRGGIICPGLSTGLRALGDRCAQLPQVRLGIPESAIGTDTQSCMLAGSVLGTAVLIDGLAQRVEQELGRPVTLVVTGGLARYVTPLCHHELTYDPELLMKGLAYLYRLNAQQTGAAQKSRSGNGVARPADKGANAAHGHRRPERGRRNGRPRAARREDEGTKSA